MKKQTIEINGHTVEATLAPGRRLKNGRAFTLACCIDGHTHTESLTIATGEVDGRREGESAADAIKRRLQQAIERAAARAVLAHEQNCLIDELLGTKPNDEGH